MSGDLRLTGLRAGYDGIPALHGIDLEVPAGSFTTVLGANGAGKSTLLKAIMGRAEVLGGDLAVGGISILGWSTHKVVRHGVALVPEGRHLFRALTVEENLAAGALGAGSYRDRQGRIEDVYERFPRLGERRAQLAGTLSGGEQQMVAIGRALMARPQLLLVDEASLGLAPAIVRNLFVQLRGIADEGVTVVAVEQSVAIAEHADTVVVLDLGRVDLVGQASDLADRLEREVAATYFGAQGGTT